MSDLVDRPHARTVVVAAVVLGLVGAIPFFAATTFITDDHLLLAFSRYAPHPFVAFVRDQLGGESYRPLPMLLWWGLARLAGSSTAPFAALAFLLHLTVAAEVVALVFAIRRDSRAAVIAGALFFVAPATREAAYWYAASMDLLATGFGIAAILAMLRRRNVVAALTFAAACWSKESAIVVPLLAVVALRAGDSPLVDVGTLEGFPSPLAMGPVEQSSPGSHTTWSVIAKRVAVLVLVAVVYLFVRTAVLHGVGGFGDPAAPFAGKLFQIAAGLVHEAALGDVASEPTAWIVGLVAWVALLFGAFRIARSLGRPAFVFAPVVWAAVAVLPLLAAPWIIGARYFYLAAVGIAWLAGELLRRSSIIVVIGVFAGLAGLSTAQALGRRSDVISYEARLSAARRAVGTGLAEGHTTFHIASGIKDLDLAVKEDPQFSRYESSLVVLGDVPASFVALPDARARELEFLLARPPLPPSGGYRFGARRIVALARRGDDPTLDEVVARLPAIRFIRLRLGPGGRVLARDVTGLPQP